MIENANYYSELGYYWDDGKEMETTTVYWGDIGLMEHGKLSI